MTDNYEQKLDAARRRGLADDAAIWFARHIDGTTRDEIEADADSLRSMLDTLKPSQGAIDPSQGQGGGQPEKAPAEAFGDHFKAVLNKGHRIDLFGGSRE
jgi:hypothetical protein